MSINLTSKSIMRFLGTIILILIVSSLTLAQTSTINLTSQQQYVRGFGGMNFPRWIGDLTNGQVDKAFGTGTGQIGMTILRTDVPYDNTQWSQQVPAAVRAKSYGAIVFASPWSPPASMKSNNNIVDGSLNTSSYSAYAQHLTDFCNYMSTNGASLYAISIQNEPDITVNYESCRWTSTQMINFLTQNASIIPTKVIVAESFQFIKSFTDPILNNSSARAQFEIIGGHIYGGGLSDYPLARNNGKEVWMTEHLVNNTDWAGALATGKEIHDCMVANFNAYVWWYIRRSYGPIDENGNVTKRGYVMSQFTKFVRPGYYRIAATASPTTNVDVTAYKNGISVVIVALNRNSSSKSITFTLQNGSVSSYTKYTTSSSKNVSNDGSLNVTNGSATITLDASSITTFVSSGTGSTTTLSVSPTSVSVAAAANSTGTFNVTSNTSWTVTDNQSWLAVSPASGSNNATVTVTAQQNTSTSSRSATVTVSASGVSSQTVTVTQAGTGGGSTSVWLEAECASVGSLWNKPTDANASNSRYVVIQSGNNSTASAPTNTAGYINFSFSVSTSGTYYLFARVLGTTANDDSYWVRMDGGTWVMWNNWWTTSWAWKQFPNTFSLSAGSHTLTFAYREDGAQLDKINLSTSSTVPTGTGSAASNLCVPKIGEEEVFNSIHAPKDFELGQNYPNPFNPSTYISFELPENSFVSLKVYNSLGVEIAELAGREYSGGQHRLRFDATDLSSGVYFYTIRAGQHSSTQKMILQK